MWGTRALDSDGPRHSALEFMKMGAASLTLISEPHFPLEHLAAIFLPLWVPLILPMLVGLLREAKRYRSKSQWSQRASRT